MWDLSFDQLSPDPEADVTLYIASFMTSWTIPFQVDEIERKAVYVLALQSSSIAQLGFLSSLLDRYTVCLALREEFLLLA